MDLLEIGNRLENPSSEEDRMEAFQDLREALTYAYDLYDRHFQRLNKDFTNEIKSK